MNVNSRTPDDVASTRKRIRRSPEESRDLILATAELRLGELGLDGLTVNGVAEAAGMSHATVIHHFGSTDGMRTALFARLTQKLLADIRTSLAADTPPEQILSRLFATLRQENHGNLLAWRMLANVELPNAGFADDFREIIAAIERDRPGEATNVVLLVAAAALGLSMCAVPLQRLIGIRDEQLTQFPSWLAGLVRG